MRSPIPKILTYMVVIGAITTVLMLLPDWLPDTMTVEGNRVDTLFWWLVAISIVILSVVMGLVMYSVRHFRAVPGDMSDGAPSHGHQWVEIIYTTIPTIIVVAISIGSYVILHRNEAKPAASKSMVVDVTGFSFGWQFAYPAAGLTTIPNLVLPINKTIEFRVEGRKNDVIHSFWVPEARLQISAVPGIPTKVQWTPDRITPQNESINVVCAQLCGTGHNAMRVPACIVSDDVFGYWLKHSDLACTDLQNTKKMKGLMA